MAIDWDFIAVCEGKDVSVGYAPVGTNGRILGKSGVTVGTGFDIGKHSEKEIDQLQISDLLKAKLKPFAAGQIKSIFSLGSFLGKNSYSWPKTTIMHADPTARLPLDFGAHFGAYGVVNIELEPILKLGEAELKELWLASKKHTTDTIIANYNRAVRKKGAELKSFESLPGPLQTAIVSFCFQFGENIGSIRFPADRRRQYWDAVTSQDWNMAVQLLDTHFHDYRSRRIKEMRLIQIGAGLNSLMSPSQLNLLK